MPRRFKFDMRNQLRIRLWIVSLALFAAGFAGRLVANAGVDNVAWSYPIEVEVQWYAYWAGLVVWMLWLALQAGRKWTAPGCFTGVLLAVASFIALISSIPK